MVVAHGVVREVTYPGAWSRRVEQHNLRVDAYSTFHGSTRRRHNDTEVQNRAQYTVHNKRANRKLYSKKPKVTTSDLQVFHAFRLVMGGYAICVNRFLSLTLSFIISVTPPCVPTPFLPLRLWSHAFLRPFPIGLSASLHSVLCLVGRRRRPTHGTHVGQGLPDRIHRSSYASSKMSKILGSSGVGLEGGSVTASSVPCASIGSSG